MNYEKPNVGLIISAVETIKGNDKGDNCNLDALQPPFTFGSTISAYEADE